MAASVVDNPSGHARRVYLMHNTTAGYLRIWVDIEQCGAAQGPPGLAPVTNHSYTRLFTAFVDSCE